MIVNSYKRNQLKMEKGEEPWQVVLEAYKNLPHDPKKNEECEFRFGSSKLSWEQVTVDGKLDFNLVRDKETFLRMVLAYESINRGRKSKDTQKDVYTFIINPEEWVNNLYTTSEHIRQRDRQTSTS